MYRKAGGKKQALKDFRSLKPTNVHHSAVSINSADYICAEIAKLTHLCSMDSSISILWTGPFSIVGESCKFIITMFCRNVYT